MNYIPVVYVMVIHLSHLPCHLRNVLLLSINTEFLKFIYWVLLNLDLQMMK